MGYNATGIGNIRLRLPSCISDAAVRKGNYRSEHFDDPFWWIQSAFTSVGFYGFDRRPSANGIVAIEVHYSNGYKEEKILDLLDMLSSYTVSGMITFSGEGGDRWRFLFVAGKWEEQRGVVHYSSQKPFSTFWQTDKTLAALMSHIQSRAGYAKDAPEQRARTLLTAFEEQDPDSVLRALTGCSLKDFLAEVGVEAV